MVLEIRTLLTGGNRLRRYISRWEDDVNDVKMKIKGNAGWS
jgi:hypothetical protein